ncbi:MAG TPA: hypothetical protein VFR97_12095 [Capillimicrobium sp.]|nr:hypothetical protein [Capillimicrobium sp.]
MQVQRTLVKSPPELWAEVSDVEALTRHLSQFGEITITRVEPETKVAWEGEHARGTVELTASGWGTKVTLTAEATERVADEAAIEAVGPDLLDEPEPEPEPGQVTAEVAVVTTADAAPEPARRGRLRWLMFWRRQQETAEVPTPTPPGPAPGPPAPPSPTPSPGPPGPPDPNPPQIEVELTEEALAATLDSLGQAHHRPFSRT